MQKYKLLLIMLLNSFLFVNCAKKEYAASDSGETTAPLTASVAESVDQVPLPEVVEVPQAPPKIDPVSCFRDYITVSPWINSTDDMTVVKPVIDSKKSVNVKLFKDAPAAIPAADAANKDAWFLSSYVLTKSDGNTQQAVKFYKYNAVGTESLDCYLMRLGNLNSSPDGLANVFFQNIGIDQNMNTVIGYMRSTTQFMACKVGKGDQTVVIKSADNKILRLPASQPFVMVRGCVQ